MTDILSVESVNVLAGVDGVDDALRVDVLRQRQLHQKMCIRDRVQAEEQNYQVAGAVVASGAIRVVVAEGGRSASGIGRLSGSNGRGTWSTSTGECAGQWTAVRRG